MSGIKPRDMQHFPGDADHEDEELLLGLRRTELSEERTQLGLQRTLWAAEQALNTWLRTALSATVAGLAVFQFLQYEVAWVAPAIATMLTLTGIALYVFALWRYSVESRRLRRAGTLVTPVWVLAVMLIPLLAAAALTLLVALS